MSDEPTAERGGLSEGLRTAIERTLAATAETRERAEALVGDVNPPAPGEVRERAAELLDEVARIGQETGQRLAQRGREAREAMVRQVEAMRPVSEPELARIVERIEALERRLGRLEASEGGDGGESQPKVEG